MDIICVGNSVESVLNDLLPLKLVTEEQVNQITRKRCCHILKLNRIYDAIQLSIWNFMIFQGCYSDNFTKIKHRLVNSNNYHAG